MKKLLLFLSLVLLYSCSVQKRKYQSGYYVSWHTKHSKKEKYETTASSRSPVAQKKEIPHQTEQAFEKENKRVVAASTKLMIRELKKSLRPIIPPEDTCDVLVFKDGSEIRGKVQEINVNEIKYKRCDNVEGPLYTSKKSDLFMIKYANGTREVIKSEAPPQRVQSPEQNNNIRNYRQQKYKRENHPLAIASLVLGILAVVLAYFLLVSLSSGLFAPAIIYILPFIAGLGAVITGKIALNRIREQPDVFKGKGMVIPGFIMGMIIVGIYLMILFIALLLAGI